MLAVIHITGVIVSHTSKLPKLVLVLLLYSLGFLPLIKGKALTVLCKLSTAWHYRSSVPMMKMSCLFQARLPSSCRQLSRETTFQVIFLPLENFAFALS